MTEPMPQVNFRQFLVDYFGSPQGVISFLGAYGAPLPGAEAASKWFYRGRVPADWLVILLCYLQLDRGGDLPLLTAYLGETSL
jgi:hypothetical protein